MIGQNHIIGHATKLIKVAQYY